MPSLVICEKPSQAKAIAAVIGANTRRDGYLEGGGYLVSFCVGHLLQLAEPQDYDERYKKWRREDLPIIPREWKYKPNPKTKDQLKKLAELLKRPDVDCVINGADSGREGELIFRLVFEHCRSKLPVKRLWISSLEESAIAEGFRNLKDGAEYETLYQSALCRQRADFLVGINGTRLFSTVYGANLKLGRVQTPTLAMIVNRDAKIAGFVKEPYYIAAIEGGGLTAEREKLSDKAAAEGIRAACDGKTAVIQLVQSQEKSVAPPRLYDLTALQREANRMFGYTATQTLNALQNLYERKCASYPRVDSRFITEDMAAGVPALVSAAAGLLPFSVDADNINVPQIVNNAGVSDHHALLPTNTAATADLSALPTAERNILQMLCVRLVSAVSEKHIYSETVITVECGGEIFTVKGKTVIAEGWKAIEQAFSASMGKKQKNEESGLPEVFEGQSFIAKSAVREGFSSPPRPHTEDTLLASMETAGAEDMPDDVERRGIGTPATRASIIESLVTSGYLERKGKQLLATQQGKNFITILPDAVKSPLLTANWETSLKCVEHGELSADDFMTAIQSFIGDIITEHSAPSAEGLALFPPKASGEVVGKCSRCGNDVTEAPKGFFCSNPNCKFALFRDNKFFTAKKKKITKEIAAALLSEGRVFMSGLHSSRTGKKYNATIIMSDPGEGYVQFELEFEKKRLS